MTKPMLTAQVNDELWARINNAAKLRGVNRSRLVRDAITVALDLAEHFPDHPMVEQWGGEPAPAPAPLRYWRCPYKGHEFAERSTTKPACCRTCGYGEDDGGSYGPLVEIDGFTQ